MFKKEGGKRSYVEYIVIAAKQRREILNTYTNAILQTSAVRPCCRCLAIFD